MNLVDRVKNIILTPNSEWSVIAAEPATTGSLLTGYAVPLAAIGPIAGFISVALIGAFRLPIFGALFVALLTFCMAIVAVFVVSLIINALAPTFAGQKDSIQALKVAVYASTPTWIAGVLRLVPLLGILIFFAALYGLYLLYLGLPKVMKSPQDKAVPYTAVVIVCAIVLTVVIAAITTAIAGVAILGSR